MRKLAYILLFVLLSVSAFAQNSGKDDLLVSHYTEQNGLLNNIVNCSLKDKEGFMWFGTQDGLNRYDGYNFKVFKNIPLRIPYTGELIIRGEAVIKYSDFNIINDEILKSIFSFSSHRGQSKLVAHSETSSVREAREVFVIPVGYDRLALQV